MKGWLPRLPRSTLRAQAVAVTIRWFATVASLRCRQAVILTYKSTIDRAGLLTEHAISPKVSTCWKMWVGIFSTRQTATVAGAPSQ